MVTDETSWEKNSSLTPNPIHLFKVRKNALTPVKGVYMNNGEIGHAV